MRPRVCALALLLAGCQASRGLLPADPGRVVEAEGWASWDGSEVSSRGRALAQAQKAAVEQAGLSIRADTRIVDGALLVQRLEASAAGLIRSFQVLSEGREGGLWRIRIRARVSSEPEPDAGPRPCPGPWAGAPSLRLRAEAGLWPGAIEGARCGLRAQGLRVAEEGAAADWVVALAAQDHPLASGGPALRGLQSWRARVSLQAFNALTGERAGESVREASGAGFSAESARNRSLESAALAAGEELGARLRFMDP